MRSSSPAEALADDVEASDVYRTLFAAYADALVVADPRASSSWPIPRPRRCSATRSTSWSACRSTRSFPTPCDRATPLTARRSVAIPSRVRWAGRRNWSPGARMERRWSSRSRSARCRTRAGRWSSRRSATSAPIRASSRRCSAPTTASIWPRWDASPWTRATRRSLLDQVPVVAAEALEVEVAMVYLLESNLLELRVASAVGDVPGEQLGDLLANRANTSLGFRARPGRAPIIVSDYSTETRFSVPARLSRRRADERARRAHFRSRANDRRSRGSLARRHDRSADDDVALPGVARESARQQPAAGAVRGGTEPCAAPGERWPAHRRHRPRLQQPADGDPGQPAGSGRAAGAGGRRPTRASSSAPRPGPRVAAPS